MGWEILAERILGDEVPFTCRYKTANWRCKRIDRCLAFRCSESGIQKTEENTGAAATAMKEEIDWKKELLESGRFNDQFSKGLLENGAKNFMQGIYLGYMYSRWKKLKGYDKFDPKENTGQMQSSLKEFWKRTKLR